MPNQGVTKWGIWALLIICLGQGLYIYISSPSRPDPSKVVSVTKVGEGGAIYEVLYDTGGATVADVYRYFLMDIQPSDEAALLKSKNSYPFLVTKSSNAVREVVEDKVKLKTNNTVYEFHSISIFKTNGEVQMVSFDLDATTP
ncbi:hypothetical protein E4P00_18005 [Pseudomonas sp. B329]|nr:hypothetical protein [Pseudomonas sp. B329]VCU64042.1 hypothetical protein [Pseudomonas synxantha]